MRCCTWSIPPYRLADLTIPMAETFVQQRVVESKATLEEYVQAQLLQNWIYNDGAYLSLAFDAMECEGNFDRLCELDWQLSATKVARESREGSFKLGVRLLKILFAMETHTLLTAYQQAIAEKRVQGLFPNSVCNGCSRPWA